MCRFQEFRSPEVLDYNFIDLSTDDTLMVDTVCDPHIPCRHVVSRVGHQMPKIQILCLTS